MKTTLFLACFLGFFILFSCLDDEVGENTLFQKVAPSRSGIHFENTLEDTPKLNILTYLYYYNGAGVAAADFNGDGLTDLYFTANQTEDKLYLNQGGFKFEDVTERAKIDNSGGWTTGVAHVDINHDGLLDIYVCKVGNFKTLNGNNLLYVNQGNDENGIPIFKEDAAAYGLDFSGFSTQSAFFDYDLDGDLDMYLLNHSVYPNRTYGKGNKRKQVDSLAGDRLYKNENGKFVDISAEAGIFQGEIGYGLGLGIGDLNNDGYPDIYVGNDFFENDYLYINQKDGTFEEIVSQDNSKLGHTTHFSMGNDLADINNDGLVDIVSLDMLPENLETYKTSGLEYPYPTYQNYLRNGYAPQFMQNSLHLNLGNENFSEIGNLAGISATEWSWGALLADYDNDGLKDLFVSNGIKGATNDMDFINFIANENIQKRIEKGMTKEDMDFIAEIPQKKVPNYFFKNQGDLSFVNVTEKWLKGENSYSNGSVYADLDNDGDLDIVVNNVDEKAFILENTTKEKQNGHFLEIGFKGGKNNPFGIGAKVIAYTNGKRVAQENFTSRGYLSAVPPHLHFGIGRDSLIDSVQVIWPGGRYQTLKSLTADRQILLDYSGAQGNFHTEFSRPATSYLKNSTDFLGFRHKDARTLEFDRDPLIPYANTNEGPAISVADVNNDGLQDLFISGAKGQASQLFVQDTDTGFHAEQQALFKKDGINEDVTQIFFDADGDGDQDLLVASGGNEFKEGKALQPRLYRNDNGKFEKDEKQFLNLAVNASKVDAVDFDADGDMDILLASDQVPHQFGATPQHYLLENDGQGNFRDVTEKISPDFQDLGNIKDFIWADLDGNGYQDLIAVGHWMPISILMNDGKSIRLQSGSPLSGTEGWWNAIASADFDNDGDIDLVTGNWGLNSKFRASKEKPITLYRADFDDNGSIEPVITYFEQEKETSFASKDELAKQLPYLNKRFLSYSDFANATIEKLFSEEKLETAAQKTVHNLYSMYFENEGNGRFTGRSLPTIAQASTIHDIAVEDFDSDGFKDVLIVGNTYEISTQLGRLDASHGLILRNDTQGGFEWSADQGFDIRGPARSIGKIKVDENEHYIIGINNKVPVFLVKEE
jgi:hypothetical protein